MQEDNAVTVSQTMKSTILEKLKILILFALHFVLQVSLVLSVVRLYHKLIRIESRDLWIMGCTGAFGYKGFYLKGDIEQSFLRIYVPRKLELPNKEKVVQISAGKMHLIALRYD
jgi:hypothetical protein